MNREKSIAAWLQAARVAVTPEEKRLAEQAAKSLEMEHMDGIPRCACHLAEKCPKAPKTVL